MSRATKYLYDSYEMFHPEGFLMCRVQRNKAEWYVNRGAAVWINDDKTQFQLTFEPNGSGKQDDVYYMQMFKNRCVCCGTEEGLTKHHVVPATFRRYFPVEFKNHSFHDILLVCGDCHEKYERFADDFKEDLCVEYTGISVRDSLTERNRIDRANAAYSVLVKHGESIPEDRKIMLEERAVGRGDLPENWSKRIVDTFETYEQYDSFIRRWRAHFVETMNPEYLPEHWSVDRELCLL